MSARIDLAELDGHLSARGPEAFLVTVGERWPHVTAVQVEISDGLLRVSVGRRSAANAAERDAVTLLWPVGPDHPDFSLLVDGTATVEPSAEPDGEGATLAVTPTTAILHRDRGRAGGAC